MQYYRIQQDKQIRNQIKPEISGKIGIESEKPLFFPCQVDDIRQYSYFLPVIEDKVLLVSDQVKEIWVEYQTGCHYRPCVIGNIRLSSKSGTGRNDAGKRIETYWITQIKHVNALSSSTEFYKDGTIKKIVLSEERTGLHKVFAVTNLHKDYYFVEKEVLERMLQNYIVGFLFEPIESE